MKRNFQCFQDVKQAGQTIVCQNPASHFLPEFKLYVCAQCAMRIAVNRNHVIEVLKKSALENGLGWPIPSVSLRPVRVEPELVGLEFVGKGNQIVML